jgi:hypothetical protein
MGASANVTRPLPTHWEHGHSGPLTRNHVPAGTRVDQWTPPAPGVATKDVTDSGTCRSY